MRHMRRPTHLPACLLALALDGMRGFPRSPGEGSTFDLRRTRSFHIFVSQMGVREGFCVRRVTASGMGVKQKVFSAKSFLPFVDKYGQFAHDDWPGKIHDDAELEASRREEDAWLKGHPCPIPDADAPYPELVEAARDVAGAMYSRRSRRLRIQP